MPMMVTVREEVASGPCLNAYGIEATFADYSNHLQHSNVLYPLSIYIYIYVGTFRVRCCGIYTPLSIIELYLVNSPLRNQSTIYKSNLNAINGYHQNTNA